MLYIIISSMKGERRTELNKRGMGRLVWVPKVLGYVSYLHVLPRVLQHHAEPFFELVAFFNVLRLDGREASKAGATQIAVVEGWHRG